MPLPVPDWSKPIILVLLVLAIALTTRWLLTARRAKRLETQRTALLGDLHAMQATLVPDVPDGIAAAGVSVAYRPADGVAAGGDFYDVFELGPGRIAVILGDVCGHGREALDRAALTRYTVRAYLQAGLPPRSALALAEDVLADTESVSFATVVVGVYEPEQARLTYACAGHPAPIVLGDGAPTPIEVCCSPPVGAGLPTGRRQSSISLAAADAVCLFTDGLTEARCDNDLLGNERLTQLLRNLGPRPSASELLERVTEEATNTPDDMAACVLLPAAPTSEEQVSRVEELEIDRQAPGGPGVFHFLTECGLTEADSVKLLGRAGRLLEVHTTAVLRVEIIGGRAHAYASAYDHPHPAIADGSHPAGGVTLPAGLPVAV